MRFVDTVPSSLVRKLPKVKQNYYMYMYNVLHDIHVLYMYMYIPPPSTVVE